MSALRLHDVSKRFGRKVALDRMSFEVPTGSLCGFVGPNGAGKTTTFGVVCGYLQPDAGEVDVLGAGPFDPWALKGRLGVLPQDAELPMRHTPRELLVHMARLQGLSRREAGTQAGDKLALVNLTDRADAPIASLSHGMRRRVAVASALVGSPELVLLDEPTAGVDPVQARALREILLSLRGVATVIVSSHNLLELEQVCDHVVMVDAGRCVRAGTLSEVTGRGERLEWTLAAPLPTVAALAAALPDHDVVCDGVELSVGAPVGADLDATTLVVLEALVAARVAVREMRRGVSLEQRFVDDAASG